MAGSAVHTHRDSAKIPERKKERNNSAWSLMSEKRSTILQSISCVT